MPRTSTTARARSPRSTAEPRALPRGDGRGEGKGTAADRKRPGQPPRSHVRLYADLAAIALTLIGALLAFSLLRPGSAGWVGMALVHFLRFWMGAVVSVAPVILLGSAFMLALDYRKATNPHMVFGIVGVLVTLFGVVHLMSTAPGMQFASSQARFAAMLGRGSSPLLGAQDGGLFGAVVACLEMPLGRGGAYLVLGAIGIASVLLISSDLTLGGIMRRAHERSRIAAERARAVNQRLRSEREQRRLEREQEQEEDEEEVAALPARSGRRKAQSLFLDVSTDETDAEEEVKREDPAPKVREREAPRRGRGLRGLIFGERDDRKAEEPTPAAAAPDAVFEAPAAAPAPPETSAIVPMKEAPEFQLETPRSPIARTAARVRSPKAGGRLAAGASPGADFVLPSLELLEPPAPRAKKAGVETEANISVLENTLGQFRIQAQVVEIADGPSVTRYEIRLGEGIRVKKILDLADNIAMSLSAMSVRVEAPIPGKAAIGIEVPKKQASVVTLKECLESDEANDLKSRVGFVLGKDVAGNVRCADLARMPHLLVAGATNSGKSVCLNVLIASMLFRARPDELKMIMIDPKRVELTLFDGIPHLIHPVVKDVKQAAGILRWVLKEMDRRYDLLGQVMTRNIEGYNEKMAKEPEKKLPFLVVVIDELADLMMQQGPEVEQSICRLAQLARATGIHLVIATQRPSVDVITGLIKANVPSRIAFAVSSQIDSRTILDCKGAENLIGRGDMLFKPVDASKPVRIQGAFLKESEVERLVNHLKAQGRPEYIAEVLSVDHGAYGTASEEEVEDELFEPAARFVVTTGHASTSMIQRKFKIGYTRAARLVDMMEARAIVGALDGAKPREIMMSRSSLDDMFSATRNSIHNRGGDDYDDEEEEIELEDETGPAGFSPAEEHDPFVE